MSLAKLYLESSDLDEDLLYHDAATLRSLLVPIPNS